MRNHEIVYLSGPYSGKTKEEIGGNIARARNYAIHFWEQGYTVICPHLNTINFEEDCTIEYDDYLEGDLDIIHALSHSMKEGHKVKMVMLPGWEESLGARVELRAAVNLGIPIECSFFGTTVNEKTFENYNQEGEKMETNYEDDEIYEHTIEKISVNERGGSQALIEEDYVQLPPHTLHAVAGNFYQGAKKHGRDNWKFIDSRDHLNHALRHAYLYLSGDPIDNHALNFVTRAMMFYEMLIKETNK